MNLKTIPVSVIIPCYNCEETIERALHSVYRQTCIPSETIIVNDASELESRQAIVKILASYEKKLKNLRVVHLSRQSGPAIARNVGWQASRQTYIAFLDADDAWHPQKLEIQYKWMRSHPNFCLCGHPSVWLQSNHGFPDLPVHYSCSRITAIRQLIANRFHTRTVMIKRNIGLRFKQGKHHSEDYLLWLEIIFSGGDAAYLHVPLAYTYKPQYGSGGLSGDLWEMERGELDTYLQIYRKGHISLIFLFFLISLSGLKFMRRLLLTYYRGLPIISI